MSNKDNISFRTEGTSSTSRIRDAIHPDFFGIDERSLADILTFILEYSKNIRYKNYENQTEGDWSPFLENNLAFVLATISCDNLDLINKKFKNAVTSINSEPLDKEKNDRLKTLIEISFQLFRKVHHWYKLSRYDLIHLDENKLVDHLKNAINIKLSRHLNDLRLLILDLNNKIYSNDKLNFPFEEFDNIWIVEFDDINPYEHKPFNLRWTIKEVSRIFKSVFSAVTHIKNIAPRLLDNVLENYPYHSPHISLLVSFVKAFEHVKNEGNLITKRHLDYYYKDILKQSLREARPDQAHVYFEPAEHVVKAVLSEGTLLSAGIDEEGFVYTYALNNSLELNQGKVTDIKNIHVAKNPIIGIGKTFSSVSNIYSREVEIDGQGMALDKAKNPGSFDSFGRDEVDISLLNREMNQAKIGFALSSPVLVLKEGLRNISLNYTFNLNSLSSLISFIEELTEKEDLSPENAFYKLLNNIFSVRYTTDSGWFKVENYEILPPKSWTSGEIRIEMILDVADPAMISFNQELHGHDYNAEWPVLEFTISSQHAMYSYSYLKDLSIEQCEIKVDVKNAKDLQVFNDLGKLDITKPFYPFGSTPDIGSYFLVGNEEMIPKNLTKLSLDIHWHNLPKAKGGFSAYYQDYYNEVGTDSFKVGITSLTDFRFYPSNEDDIQKVNLFEEDPHKKTLKNEVSIDEIDLEKLGFIPNYKKAELSDYTSKTRSGFFKFEIMEPESGFGHSIYPKLFAKAVLENSKAARMLSKEKEKIELPNEPYAPQIRSIGLNYSASAKVIMNVNKVSENDKAANNQVYHLHPFGNKVVFEAGLPVTGSLVPQFDEEGYLILGLENIQAPVEISFYFELEDNVKNEINHANIPVLKWRYLVDDTWVDFEENEVVFDGTNNFTTSGIVKLKVPSTINKEHRILPGNKYWIALSTELNSEILSKTVMVQTNGASVTWRSHKEGEQWKNNIPAHTISGFVDTRSDVNGVNQPFPSFGGRSRETSEMYYTRVSERLKHKNRAVTPNDFEKIILNKFPFLFQVKCINHFSHPEFVKKGWIKLIVVPRIEHSQNFYTPKVNYNQLEKIQEYIEQLVSPYTSIEVINPSYEKVKTNFKVVMKSTAKAGEYVKRLEDDLMRFICPWYDEDQGEMNFGGSIERDDILSFIEGLEYVNFLTKLSVIVLHQVNGKYDISDSADNEGNNNELKSSSPWSVLVPSEHHEIELIDKPSYELAKEKRIETMKIGDDFVIVDEKEEVVEFPFFDLNKDTYYAIEIDL